MADTYLKFTLTIGDTPLATEGLLLSVSTIVEMNRIPSAVITLMDGDPTKKEFTLGSDADTKPGKAVTIKIGIGALEHVVFKGVIVKHSLQIRNSQSRLILECRHESHKLTLGRNTRYIEAKTDDKVITAILTDASLAAKFDVGTAGFIADTAPVQFQYDCSDWDYLLTRIQLNSKVVYFDLDADSAAFEKMKIDTPATAAAAITLSYGTNILEFESDLDSRTQFDVVNSKAWDLATIALATDGNPGAASAFSQLTQNDTGLKAVSAPATFDLLHSGPVPIEERKAWSKSYHTLAALSKVRGRIKIVGGSVKKTDETAHYNIKVGDTIKLDGLGDKFNGDVLVTGVRHELNTSGWFTHIQFGLSPVRYTEKYNINGPKAGGLTAAVHGLQVGKVLKLDEDPATEHRIQITLPIGGVDAKVWARFITPDGGADRGFFFWPEIGDEVIVGFMNDDPRFPVVLGSVFSSTQAPTVLPTAENNTRAIISKGDVRVTFDDELMKLTLTTPGGHTVVMDDDGGKVEMECSNGNKLTLDDKGITLDSCKDINLKSAGKVIIKATGDATIDGVNITAKASAKFTAKGNSGIEVSSSANAVVKGAMVQIN